MINKYFNESERKGGSGGAGRVRGKKKERKEEKEGGRKDYMSLQCPGGLSFQLRRQGVRVHLRCPLPANTLRTRGYADTKSMQNSIFPNLMHSIAIFIEKGREMRQETKQL